jgi:hypothetical protein
VSIALIAGVLIVWLAQTAPADQTIHEESIFNVSYAVIDQMSCSNTKRCRRVRCLRDVNAA